MLLESSSDLELAKTVGFELVGPGFRYAGLAAVAHRQDGAIGLRFLSWDGPVERPAGVLVAARLRGQQLGLHDPGKLGIVPPPMWDSRGHDRAAVSGLSALIEQSPGSATRRHQVLNVSEQGMLIDGLALLPIGARISFMLAGSGIGHLGRGRVAHWTDTSAGVAVDHGHGAPEAIRGLITCESELGPRLVNAYISDWSRVAEMPVGEDRSADQQRRSRDRKPRSRQEHPDHRPPSCPGFSGGNRSRCI